MYAEGNVEEKGADSEPILLVYADRNHYNLLEGTAEQKRAFIQHLSSRMSTSAEVEVPPKSAVLPAVASTVAAPLERSSTAGMASVSASPLEATPADQATTTSALTTASVFFAETSRQVFLRNEGLFFNNLQLSLNSLSRQKGKISKMPDCRIIKDAALENLEECGKVLASLYATLAELQVI